MIVGERRPALGDEDRTRCDTPDAVYRDAELALHLCHVAGYLEPAGVFDMQFHRNHDRTSSWCWVKVMAQGVWSRRVDAGLNQSKDW